jgi:hypothetical protein
MPSDLLRRLVRNKLWIAITERNLGDWWTVLRRKLDAAGLRGWDGYGNSACVIAITEWSLGDWWMVLRRRKLDAR